MPRRPPLFAEERKKAAEASSSRGHHQSNSDESETAMDPLMAQFKAELTARGANGILGLKKLFRIIADGCKDITFSEFKRSVMEMDIPLSPTETMQLFNKFGTNGPTDESIFDHSFF